jgi:Fic family protein
VTIHPFTNGNGRHARLLAHVAMVRHFTTDPVPWGTGRLRSADENRSVYIAALVAADNRDFGPLLAFARGDPFS